MKTPDPNSVSPVDGQGTLSTEFIARSGLKLRLLGGVPTLLELGILNFFLQLRASKATVELFEEDGTLFRSYTIEPSVPALVDLMHDKFAKAALVRSMTNSEMAYFDYSNDYFMFLGSETDLEKVFHLDRNQMIDHFEDVVEGSLDETYLRSIFASYERFM
jgi:hypothetical protein